MVPPIALAGASHADLLEARRISALNRRRLRGKITYLKILFSQVTREHANVVAEIQRRVQVQSAR